MREKRKEKKEPRGKRREIFIIERPPVATAVGR
jgi:hypothetical protein